MLRISYVPPKNLKGLFAGSGSDGLNEPEMIGAILRLVDKEKPRILYLGTATYDLPGPRLRQTQRFLQAGCSVTSLDVAAEIATMQSGWKGFTEAGCTVRSLDIVTSAADDMADAVESADVVVVSGGNTLFAVDRFKRLGLNELLRCAMNRGVVLAGGSAGAICWFDGGHSDSMDPGSFKRTMLAEVDHGRDESSAPPTCERDKKAWEFIRVDGMGFLPGIVCPHHDRIQSNGILRAHDFDSMLLQHPTEIGIGIDHWAALELNQGRYRVISLKGKEGSVMTDRTFSPDRNGVPGVWLKEVGIDGQVHSRICPDSGSISDLIHIPVQIHQDPRVILCRTLNPDDAPVPMVLQNLVKIN
jgi:dipeptidase E